jgi:hypothetical protein
MAMEEENVVVGNRLRIDLGFQRCGVGVGLLGVGGVWGKNNKNNK